MRTKDIRNKDHNDNSKETTDIMDEMPNAEGMRARARCSGRLRHPRECRCGRQRRLIRLAGRWHRLGACRRCLQYRPPTAPAPMDDHSAADRKEVDHA